MKLLELATLTVKVVGIVLVEDDVKGQQWSKLMVLAHQSSQL